MKKIAIVVGHGKSKTGGYDPGACANGYQEFKLAKEFAKYAQEYLNEHYDCQADLFNYNGDTYLTDRVARFKDNTYSLLAEIHLNAGGGTGTEVYYSRASKKKPGQQAAEQIAAQIAAEFGIRNRGAKLRLRTDGRDHFAIIRDTKPHAVLAETLFIDSQSDRRPVESADGQKKMGKAIAVGIAKAMELQGKKEKPASKPTPGPVLPPYPFIPAGIVKIGSTVKVKKGARSYEGKKIASFVYSKTYTVDQLKGDRAVLDLGGICTAFKTSDLEVVG